MANVEFARTGIADPQVARQAGDDEITEVVAMAWSVARHACSILDEGPHLEVEVEVPGWTERVAVLSPARPGAVRGAVEKVLRDLGLTAVPHPTRADVP
jgi:hypothetical protein